MEMTEKECEGAMCKSVQQAEVQQVLGERWGDVGLYNTVRPWTLRVGSGAD